MKKTANKHTDYNRRKILNSTINVLDMGRMLNDSSIESNQKIGIISKQTGLLDSISKTLAISDIRGKGAVLSGISMYTKLLSEYADMLKNEPLQDIDASNNIYPIIEHMAYRIQNKLCERLFPDDDVYINNRMNHIEIGLKTIRPTIISKLTRNGIFNLVSKYRYAYFYEEDEESIIVRKILGDFGVDNIKGYIAFGDTFRLKNDKILSFEEALITDEDVVIFTAQKTIREFDISSVGEKNIKNILQLDLFDQNHNTKLYDIPKL